jgi:hypothetical protein
LAPIFVKPQWEDFTWLSAQTARLYERIQEKNPSITLLSLTRDKIVEHRGWAPSLPLIKNHLDAAIQELGIFYVPAVMQPGPMFVFPILSLDGSCKYAQTKPLSGSVTFKAERPYKFIGEEVLGPRWFGNTPETLKALIRMQSVVTPEGPFDLLACRALGVQVPSLSSLTKKLGAKHQAYLRLLGVKRLHLLFDNELPKGNRTKGQGNLAMDAMPAIEGIEIRKMLCSASDPSDCLKNKITATRLKDLLESTVL